MITLMIKIDEKPVLVFFLKDKKMGNKLNTQSLSQTNIILFISYQKYSIKIS